MWLARAKCGRNGSACGVAEDREEEVAATIPFLSTNLLLFLIFYPFVMFVVLLC